MVTTPKQLWEGSLHYPSGLHRWKKEVSCPRRRGSESEHQAVVLGTSTELALISCQGPPNMALVASVVSCTVNFPESKSCLNCMDELEE